ncbi:hypothetical protein AAMO2058_000402900 [Amorphochlora amoebiformis]
MLAVVRGASPLNVDLKRGQIFKRKRVAFDDSVRYREFTKDKGVVAKCLPKPGNLKAICQPSAQIQVSREAFEVMVFNRTWRTIFQSKRLHFGFRFLHGESVYLLRERRQEKMNSGKFLQSFAQSYASSNPNLVTLVSSKELKIPSLDTYEDMVITKRGSTLSELLRISPRALSFDRYLNPLVQYLYERLRIDVRMKTDREWNERRLEYRWNVQHAGRGR